MFKVITPDDISVFRSILGDRCLVDDESLYNYSHDETEDISILPSVVLKPNTTEEVSEIMITRILLKNWEKIIQMPEIVGNLMYPWSLTTYKELLYQELIIIHMQYRMPLMQRTEAGLFTHMV